MPKNNTVIHKSFSKKDLLKVIQEFDITIGVDESYTKSTVANTLWGILTKLDFLYIPPDNNYLVKDLIGLITSCNGGAVEFEEKKSSYMTTQ